MECFYKFYSFKYILLKYFCISMFSLFFSTFFFLDECLSNTVENIPVTQKKPDGVTKLIIDKSICDFGNIKPNSTHTAVFNLTNAGKKTLVIEDVRKCCGAVIKFDKKVIAPGESSTLSVKYQFSTGSGTFKKMLSFKTNEPNSPQITLTVIGTMIQTLQWRPQKFQIAAFLKDIECPIITIKSLDNTPFSISSFTSSCHCLAVEFDPNYTATEINLKPRIIREKIKELNSNKGSVNINLNHPNYKTITLNFDIIPSLLATPAQILVFNSDINEPITRSIVLQDNEKQNESNISTQIESITSENGTTVEIIKSVMADMNCKLDLKITPIEKKDSKTLLKDQILIKLKDGRTLKVPIRIFYATKTLTSKLS